MKVNIKEFQCVIEIGKTKTYYSFKTFIEPNNRKKPYQLITHAEQYEFEEIILESDTISYYDNIDELNNAFEYHYTLNEKNYFTTHLKRIN